MGWGTGRSLIRYFPGISNVSRKEKIFAIVPKKA